MTKTGTAVVRDVKDATLALTFASVDFETTLQIDLRAGAEWRPVVDLWLHTVSEGLHASRARAP